MHINAILNDTTHEIEIEQKIVYHNNSDTILNEIYLLNWANGYKNRKTALAKRLIENYDRSLYFAKIDKRGFSEIESLKSEDQNVRWNVLNDTLDIIKISLSKPLLPKDSITINAKYLVKVPINKYTKYGYNASNVNYNLRYWYLVPAVYDKKWHLASNLDMDDFYMNPTDYSMIFKIPIGYTLHSDLASQATIHEDQIIYDLKDLNRTDVEINIQLVNNFSLYQTDSIEIISNLKSENLTENIKSDVLNRQLNFISEYLGAYPHKKLMVNEITYLKNPVYGLNQLPKSLTPFSDVFMWDIKMFKTITNRYIENTIIVNKREDYWLTDGIQIYLMMKYVERILS